MWLPPYPYTSIRPIELETRFVRTSNVFSVINSPIMVLAGQVKEWSFVPCIQQRYRNGPGAPKAHINDGPLNSSHSDTCSDTLDVPELKYQVIWESVTRLSRLRILVRCRRSCSLKVFFWPIAVGDLMFYRILHIHGTLWSDSARKFNCIATSEIQCSISHAPTIRQTAHEGDKRQKSVNQETFPPSLQKRNRFEPFEH